MRLQINVVTILCRALIGTGRQWTKRILPEHLIPRSPLWSEKLVELLEGQQDADRGLADVACAALGCVDPRTARKHIRALRAAAAAKLPALAELGAAAPGTGGGPDFLPGTNPFVILRLLWDNSSGPPRNAPAHSSLFRSDRFSGSDLGSNPSEFSIDRAFQSLTPPQ